MIWKSYVWDFEVLRTPPSHPKKIEGKEVCLDFDITRNMLKQKTLNELDLNLAFS